MSRGTELAARLTDVQRRIARAAETAGRDPAAITLIAISKTRPCDDVRALADLGVRDFGENRAGELIDKAEKLADLRLRWHFVGQLQTNKAAPVAGIASLVHSVDRPRLVTVLDRAAGAAGRALPVLIQVSLDAPGESSGQRGGAPAHEVPELADAVGHTDALRLAGVMGVAPLAGDPRRAFAALAEIAAALRTKHPDARSLSAGMSGDLDAAIACGSTHVRVGTALFGARATLVR